MDFPVLTDKKAAFLSLGCKVNAYETESIKQSFISYGAEIVDFKEIADIYVVNTCTVTNIADRKSRQMLHRAKKLNPEAIIVATGCYVQESAEKLKEEGCVDVLIGNRLKNKVAELTALYISEGKKECRIYLNENENDYEEMNFVSSYKNSRVDIKIQDGCNQFCSYCIIPYARGRISSRNPLSVISEVESLASRGYKEVVLTGIHISSYGLDECSRSEQAKLRRIDGRMPLVELVEKINEIPGIERIRIGSFEPRIVDEEFAERLSACDKFMPHFHLSLQSGCDSVLQRMNRKYSCSEYINSCEILRKYFYKPSITTDIIVGFPGETEEEFSETCEFVKKAGFAAIHIFPYSVREGTRAAGMPGQLTNEEKSKRAERLAEIEKTLRKEYETSFDGEYRKILVEEKIMIDGREYAVGFTPEYVKTVTEAEAEVNELFEVKMSGNYLADNILAN